MRSIEFTVSPEKDNQRLDLFLFNSLENLFQREYSFQAEDGAEPLLTNEISRSQMARLIQKGNVSLGSQVILKPSHKVNLGEIYQVQIPEAEHLSLRPQDLKLQIVFEDDDLAIINKPYGLVVHPEGSEDSPQKINLFPRERKATLVEGLLFALENLSGINGIFRPGIVHRLDKDTEGLLVVAKNNHTHQSLSRQFAERQVKKKYRAIVMGQPGEKNALLEAEIVRDPKNRIKMKILPLKKTKILMGKTNRLGGGSKARKIVTGYQVLESIRTQSGSFSFLEIDLFTGRTHQIRAHLSFLGFPVLGDSLYGKKGPEFLINAGLENMMYLQSFSLAFIHPVSQKWQEFTLPVPERFDSAWKTIRQNSIV
jgi:23S rRNA pseudouridine1911/1915/1917 synthase